MISIHPENPQRAIVLAAIDDSSASRIAAAAAARFARLPGTEIHFVHVLPKGTADAGRREVIDSGVSLLRRTAAELGLEQSAMLHVSAGTAWREIVQLAANLHADVVIVGTHDPKPVERFVKGSVAADVVRNAHCPVFVARAKDYSAAAPEIEPPCEACLAAQNATNGATLWCDRHAGRHAHGRVHYGFSNGVPSAASQFIRV